MRYSIRRASPIDSYQMTLVYTDAFLGFATYRRDVEEVVLLCVRVSRGCCRVAEVDGRIVGMGCLFPYERVGWIGLMAVKRCFQRRGIGSEILNQLLADAETMGLEGVGLDATEAGLRLYRKFGFVEMGKVSTYLLPMSMRYAASVDVDQWPSDALAKLDSIAFGSPRPNLLIELARSGAKFLRCGSSYGVVWGRRLGPLLGRSLGEVIAVASRALELGARALTILEGSRGSRLVEVLGLEGPKSTCVRMARGWVKHVGELVWATAGYAFG